MKCLKSGKVVGFTLLQVPMEMAITHYIINGDEPRIVGQACTGLVLLHFGDEPSPRIWTLRSSNCLPV